MSIRNLLAQKPAEKLTLDVAVSNITTAAWTVVTAATLAACDAIQIGNTTDDILLISTGALGAEANGILPIYIGPCDETVVLPFPLAKGTRISVKAVNHNVTYGDLILNTYS
jgi:hypothetical protein